MATLADVNQTLMDQNLTLGSIAKSTMSTQDLILKQISQNTGFKSIEESREKGGGIISSVSGTLKGIKDTGAKLGGFLGKKGLAGIGAALVGGLLTRGVPALVATAFSDNIAEFLTGEEGNEEVKSTIERAIVGGSLGFLLGWRGALVGSLLGALLTDDNRKKLEDLGDQFGALADEFGLTLPTFEQTLGFLTESFGNLISFIGGILGTITGIIKSFKAFTDGDETTSGFEELGETASNLGTNLRDNALGATVAAAGLYGAGRVTGIIPKVGGKNKSETTPKQEKTKATKTQAQKTSNIVKKDGKEFVKSKNGKLFLRGTQQADMIENRGGYGNQEKPKTDNLKKFPKLGMALKILGKIPGLSMIMGMTELATMNPMTVDGVAGVLGGLGGGAAGAIVGTFFGGPVGGFFGGLGGYFLGDALFTGIAQYLLGKKVDAFPGFINDMINGGEHQTETAKQLGGGGETTQQPAQPLSDYDRISKRTTTKRIQMLERGDSFKINGKEATPQQRLKALDKEYDKLAKLDEKEFRYNQRMEQSQYRTGTVESINGEALQDNVDGKNQPAVIMQDNSAPQVNNVNSSSSPMVSPLVSNSDVNDSLGWRMNSNAAAF